MPKHTNRCVDATNQSGGVCGEYEGVLPLISMSNVASPDSLGSGVTGG